MKLKIPGLYSQRDSAWGSIILGNNPATARDQYNHPYNIYWYGCLITCLGMYVGKTPDQVNTLLKPNGFANNSGEFSWPQSSLLGITQTYLSPRYADIPVTPQGFSKIRELLDGGFPLLCEIDFNPNTQGEEQHYVLLYGYDGETYFAQDPWTGTVIDLSIYGGPARAIIQFRAYDMTVPKSDGTDLQSLLDQVRQERDRNWNWFKAVCDALHIGTNVDTAVAEAAKLITMEDALIQKDRQIADATTKIADLESKITMLQQDHETLTANMATQAKTIQDQDGQIKELSTSLQELKDGMAKPSWSAIELILAGIRKLLGGK